MNYKPADAPLISFITIDYNGLQDTCELIESLFEKIISVSFEVIVIDNASKNDEAEIIQRKYPQITALRSERNLGFSGGNNLGIIKARGMYVFLINNDTFVLADGIKAMVEKLESDPSIAGVSPKILFAGPDHHIQFAGYEPLTKITLRNNIIGFEQADDGRWDKSTHTPIVHGAAMMLKKSAIDMVGLMPEIYFLYYEELDWSASFLRAGYNFWYVPECVVYHKGSRSTGVQSPLQVFYMTRNRLLYASRNLTGNEKWLSILYQFAIANTKAVLFFVFKRKLSLVKACLKGEYAFLKMRNQ
jgi:GT2 family glycosyltransferase